MKIRQISQKNKILKNRGFTYTHLATRVPYCSEHTLQFSSLRCIDIYELIEHEKLLAFHVQTLKLYSALCYQSNYRAQHAICHYCDGRQLLCAIQSEFMPGIYLLLSTITIQPIRGSLGSTQ